jgi:hypothetical protein
MEVVVEWEDSMHYELGTAARAAGEGSPDAVAKLIRKLRWIGMEDEARRLERTACTPPPQKATIRRPDSDRAMPVHSRWQ